MQVYPHTTKMVQRKFKTVAFLLSLLSIDLCSCCNMKKQYKKAKNMVAENKTDLKRSKESKISKMIEENPYVGERKNNFCVNIVKKDKNKIVNVLNVNRNYVRPNEGLTFKYGSHIPVRDVNEKPHGGLKYYCGSQSSKPDRKNQTVCIKIGEARKECFIKKDFRNIEEGVCEKNPTENQISGRDHSFLNYNYRPKSLMSGKQNPITITKDSNHMKHKYPIATNCYQNGYNIHNVRNSERSTRKKRTRSSVKTRYQNRNSIYSLCTRGRLPRRNRSDSQTRTRVLYSRKYDYCKSDEDTDVKTKVKCKQGDRRYNYTNMKEIEQDYWDTRSCVKKENEFNNGDKRYDVLKEKNDEDKRCKVDNGHGKRENKDKTWKEKEFDNKYTIKEDKNNEKNRFQYSKDKQFDQTECFKDYKRANCTCEVNKKETSPKENACNIAKDQHNCSEKESVIKKCENTLNKCEKVIFKKGNQSKEQDVERCKQQKSEKESSSFHKIIQKKFPSNEKMICQKRSSDSIAIRIEADIALDTREGIISSSEYEDDDLCPYCRARNEVKRETTMQRVSYTNTSMDSKEFQKGDGRNSQARKTVVDEVHTKGTQSHESKCIKTEEKSPNTRERVVNIRELCNYFLNPFGSYSETKNPTKINPCNNEIRKKTTIKNEEYKKPEEKIIDTKETSKTHVCCEKAVLDNIFSQINSIKSDVKRIQNSKKKESKVLKVESLIRENNDLKRHFAKLEKRCEKEREKCRIMWERMEAENVTKTERIDLDEVNKSIAGILERIQQREFQVIGKFNSFARFTTEYRNILSDYYKNVSARADHYFETKRKNIEKKEEKMNQKYETVMQMIEEETKKLNIRLERFRDKVDDYENRYENQKKSLEMKRHSTHVPRYGQNFRECNTKWSKILNETARYDRIVKRSCPSRRLRSTGRSRHEFKTNQFVCYEQSSKFRMCEMCPRHRNPSLHKPSNHKHSHCKHSHRKHSHCKHSHRKHSHRKHSHRKSSIDIFHTALDGTFSGICITKYCELKAKHLTRDRDKEEKEKERLSLFERIKEFVTGNTPDAARSFSNLPSTMICRNQ